MRQRLIGVLLLAMVPSVGAFALPAQAAIEKAAALERTIQENLNKAGPSQKNGPATPGTSDSSPVVLLAAPHWTVEKISRYTELPKPDRRAICLNDQELNWLAPRKLARLNLDMVWRTSDQVAQPVRIHLVGANSPPVC